MVSQENEEISLKELIGKGKEWTNYFLSQWKIILIIGFVGAGLGLSYSMVKKPEYTASLSFALESDGGSGGLGGALGLASQFGLDLNGSGGGMFAGANLIELFKSRIMVQKALLAPVDVNGKRMSMAEMYIQNKGWRTKWDENAELKKLQFLPDSNAELFTRQQDSVLGMIYSDLSKNLLTVYQKDKKISIITMEVLSKNELFAKYFCENLARKVSQFYINVKSKKSRINMDILNRQTDSIRAELNSAINGVAVANDNTFNLNPALNVRRATSTKKQVDVQANIAILSELVRQTELAKVTLRNDIPLIQVIDKPILPLPVDRLGKLKGIILGGFLGGFFTILYLTFKRLIA
ncbi:lipopolysaccharide biosynthesis protein [Flavobacterium sp. LC2016-12]|uniref:lipopolysaccharide biosynthesis protein n=1 Tax=Flavobacterium sp. LC2016-12 TaxID=2783794 RepID=UPI00188AB3F4|nr:lipopolysaccharide biosynthesis protein [Flavobacterium sp. LC2016-12]MBF4465690.1 lipopolysaccharide biosynthesis protein [Flavobacterium sp. LC2016-12]